MSTIDVGYPVKSGGAAPEIIPQYGTSLPTPSNEVGSSGQATRCVTGFGFIKSLPGMLNIVIIIALACVLISAGVSNRDDGKQADSLSYRSNAKVSAYNTRNAVLAFAVIGLILILLDTILYVTGLIKRLPPAFETIFIIIMFVLAGIYLILGCCAAAWEKKMSDTLGSTAKHRGAAGAASFFIFVTMFAVIGDFVLRLFRPTAEANISS